MSKLPKFDAITAAAIYIAADHGIDLQKIVRGKAGVDHSTREAKQRRKAWRKQRAKLTPTGDAR